MASKRSKFGNLLNYSSSESPPPETKKKKTDDDQSSNTAIEPANNPILPPSRQPRSSRRDQPATGTSSASSAGNTTEMSLTEQFAATSVSSFGMTYSYATAGGNLPSSSSQTQLGSSTGQPSPYSYPPSNVQSDQISGSHNTSTLSAPRNEWEVERPDPEPTRDGWFPVWFEGGLGKFKNVHPPCWLYIKDSKGGRNDHVRAITWHMPWNERRPLPSDFESFTFEQLDQYIMTIRGRRDYSDLDGKNRERRKQHELQVHAKAKYVRERANFSSMVELAKAQYIQSSGSSAVSELPEGWTQEYDPVHKTTTFRDPNGNPSIPNPSVPSDRPDPEPTFNGWLAVWFKGGEHEQEALPACWLYVKDVIYSPTNRKRAITWHMPWIERRPLPPNWESLPFEQLDRYVMTIQGRREPSFFREKDPVRAKTHCKLATKRSAFLGDKIKSEVDRAMAQLDSAGDGSVPSAQATTGNLPQSSGGLAALVLPEGWTQNYDPGTGNITFRDPNGNPGIPNPPGPPARGSSRNG